MDKVYDEMVKESAKKIQERSRRDLLDALYEEIQNGKIKFNIASLQEAVRKMIGDDGTEWLDLKIENIYNVLKYRLSAPIAC